MGLSAAISIAAVALLTLFLTTKELAGASQSVSFRLISRSLSIGIIPLVIVFAGIVVVKITEILA